MSAPGAFSDERDTQDTSSEEHHRERDMQDTLARSLETKTPDAQEGLRHGVWRLWDALARLTALERHHRRCSSHAAPTKNEKKRLMGKEDKER